MQLPSVPYLTPEALTTFIRTALAEDVGDGDHSALAAIPATARNRAHLLVKGEGLLAGVALAGLIFAEVDPQLILQVQLPDGTPVRHGDVAFTVEGPARSILTAERLVLNCMQRMSGIATLTKTYTNKLQGYKTKLLDTRKTTPNFRLLEKEAVRIGGGVNHRFGLFDMIMLKDNHIDYAGGLEAAINRAHDYVQRYKPQLKIEVETRSLQEVKKIVAIGKGKVHRVMLDNFLPEQVTEAVGLIGDVFETEASGGINLNTIQSYAAAGVDYVSVGGLIHQARSLDLSLKASIES